MNAIRVEDFTEVPNHTRSGRPPSELVQQLRNLEQGKRLCIKAPENVTLADFASTIQSRIQSSNLDYRATTRTDPSTNEVYVYRLPGSDFAIRNGEYVLSEPTKSGRRRRLTESEITE